MVTGQIDWQALDQLTTVWLTPHAHGGRPRPPAHRPPDGQPRPPATARTARRTPATAASPRRRPDPRRRPRAQPGQAAPGDSHSPRPGPARPQTTAPAAPATARRHGARHGGGHDCAWPAAWPTPGPGCRPPSCAASTSFSGPGGLASYLRGTLLDAPFTTLSQPLDIGRTTRTIPPHLRTAVIQRDQHCQFPGCTQPPSVCDVHHLIPWAQGGPTSLGNLGLLCRFHHHIVIHRWGWTITRHPDGTTTATAPDGRTLHSHGPPQQAA